MNSATAACLLRRVIVAQQSLRHGAAIERATRMAASKITKSAHPSSAATIIRFFGTPAEKVAESSSTTAAVVTDSDNYEKLVEANIKKLLSDDSQEEVKPISNEDLEIRLEHYKVRLMYKIQNRTSDNFSTHKHLFSPRNLNFFNHFQSG